MLILFYFLSYLGVITSGLPFIPNQHWIFRVWEFGRIQILIFQIATLLFGLIFISEKDVLFWVTVALSVAFIANHIFILAPYTFLFKKNRSKNAVRKSESISIISVNVYQFNKDYKKLIDLINKYKPDILLTIESDETWEEELEVIEKDYPNYKKVPLKNTYGLHFYTKLDVNYIDVNYFIADDLPSIEAHLISKEGIEFSFYGVHPPPPSPSEEETSKERDGELLAIGKEIKKNDGPVIIAGDFNNVAWAKSSKLFRKTAELIDPRIGHGFVSTYHAKYRLFRFPIDLFFHSEEIIVEEFKTLEPIGSDHLPLYCSFFLIEKNVADDDDIETLESGEDQEVDELIEEGKKEQSDNRKDIVE